MKIEVYDGIFYPRGFYTLRLRDARTGLLLQQVHSPLNLFVNKGKDLIFKLLRRETGVVGANYLAIGTGTTSPASGDIKLQTEIDDGGADGRQTIGLTTFTEGTYSCVFSTFWDANEPKADHTINEVGIFGNAAKTKDNGYLISRVVLGAGVTKNVGTHTLDVDYTLSF